MTTTPDRPFRCGGPDIHEYEVQFSLSQPGHPETLTVYVDVNSTGHDDTDRADAILGATLTLDDRGITEWSVKSCARVVTP